MLYSHLDNDNDTYPLLEEEEEEEECCCCCCSCREHYSIHEGNFPVLLKCAHSICRKCAIVNCKENIVCCPICGEQYAFDLAEDKVPFIWDFQSIDRFSCNCTFHSREENQRVTCSVCSCDQDLCKCTECCMNLCAKCQVPHKIFPTTANHTLSANLIETREENDFEICEFRQEKEISPSCSAFNTGVARCVLHESTIIYQCEADGEFLCPYCLISNHNGHRVTLLASRFDQAKNNSEFEEIFHKASDTRTQLEELKRHIEESQKKLSQDFESINEEFCYEIFEALEEYIDELKRSVREKVNNAFGEKMRFLCQKRFEIETLVENLGAAQDFLKTASESGMVVNSLVLSQEIKRMLCEIDQISPTYNGYLSGSFVRINSKEFDKIEDIISQPISRYIQVAWETPLRRRKVSKPSTLSTGDCVQVLWNESVWYTGYIVEIKGEKIKVSYLGWSEKWDEWLDKTSLRICLNDSI